MTFRPISRSDAEKVQSPKDDAASVTEDVFTSEPQTDVTVLARMLAAVGGGAVSQGLALDLVLYGFVEQARKTTGASGAAIALLRDGHMICRATTGNAPDLGVRVETESGISGACLITGNVQLCSDTDIDPRVNAEACRRLNVRSMLMAPISDGKHNFGIVEVFAAQPGAFSDEHIKALQVLALQVADSKKASEAAPRIEASPSRNTDALTEAPPAESQPQASELFSAMRETEPSNRGELLNSVLVVSVVAVAIILGVVIGVGVRNRNAQRAPSPNPDVAASPTAQGASATSTGPASTAEPAGSPATTTVPSSPVSLEPPSGGLIVTQNGKLIYRSDSPAAGQTPTSLAKSRGRLIHRVDPTYPEAARAQHIEGAVVLNAHVSGDGSVGEIEIISGDPLLAQAATQAVRKWKYQPYSENGQPVDRQERITVRFSLPST